MGDYDGKPIKHALSRDAVAANEGTDTTGKQYHSLAMGTNTSGAYMILGILYYCSGIIHVLVK